MYSIRETNTQANIINNLGSTSAIRNANFITCLSDGELEIIIANRLASQAGVNKFVSGGLIQVPLDNETGDFVETNKMVLIKKKSETMKYTLTVFVFIPLRISISQETVWEVSGH